MTAFIAGTRQGSMSAAEGPTLMYVPAEAIYKVTKPWGYELWLNGRHPHYSLKFIYLREGTKTSLQYHEQKYETNVLFSGAARLHFVSDDRVYEPSEQPIDIRTVKLAPISVVDIPPGTIHRIEAVSDVILVEASTSHLYDVVRLEDDSGRKSGWIDSEHSS